MKKLLERLYLNYGESSVKCPEEEQRVQARRGNFKKTLKRRQYRQILRLIDDTDLITDKMSMMNFERGVKFAVKLMSELYSNAEDDVEG